MLIVIVCIVLRKLLLLTDIVAGDCHYCHFGEDKDAWGTCVLLSEESGKRWQVVYMS